MLFDKLCLKGLLLSIQKNIHQNHALISSLVPNWAIQINENEIFAYNQPIHRKPILELSMSDFPSNIQTTLLSGSQTKIRSLFIDFFANYTIDDHRFQPYGYSINGVNGTSYFTIHITPQEPWKCITFESNTINYDHVKQLLTCFSPNEHQITIIVHFHHILPKCFVYGMFSIKY